MLFSAGRKGSSRERGKSQAQAEEGARSKRHSTTHQHSDSRRPHRPSPSSSSLSTRSEQSSQRGRERDDSHTHSHARDGGDGSTAARPDRLSLNRLSGGETTTVCNRFEALELESEDQWGVKNDSSQPEVERKSRRHSAKGQLRSDSPQRSSEQMSVSGAAEESGGEGDSGVKDLDGSVCCSDGESGRKDGSEIGDVVAVGRPTAEGGRISYSKVGLALC